MRVLIVLNNSPAEKYLVHLHNEPLVAEIRGLVNSRKYSQAIAIAFIKGVFERRVLHHEVPVLNAGLILSEESASWDLLQQ